MLRANVRPDPVQRLADYDEALKLTPHDPGVLRFRGMFHLTQNRVEDAISDLAAAAEMDPKNADTHEALGIAQLMAQKFDDGARELQPALELAPDSPGAL